MSEWPKVYAWTPGKPGYNFYPQFANFKLWEDGRCVITIRALEFRTVGEEHYEMGETVCIQLPSDAASELRAFFASADTHPKDGDSTQIESPLGSGAVPLAADAHTTPPSSNEGKLS